MRAAVVTLAVLAAALAPASAGSVDQYATGDCTGTKTTNSFSSGKCRRSSDSDGAAIITCSGNTYTVVAYSSNDCSGASVATFNGTVGVCLAPGNGASFLVTDCSGCFSGSSTVQLESGATVSMGDVKVGDRVLSLSSSGKAFYDKVFRITHHEPEETMGFVRITTSSGDVLELTPTHTVHVDTCCAPGSAIQASQVTVGSKLFTANMQEVTVTDVETVLRTGVFNFHTLGGNVVVNNIAATHYGKPAWTAAPSLATAWYHVVDAMSSVVGAEDASKKDVHGSLRA